MEVFCEGLVAVLDDFKKLQLIGKGRTRKIRKHSHDKGHKKELQMFVHAVKDGNPMPVPFRDSVMATVITFMIEKSLRQGIPMEIDIGQFAI